MLDAVRGSVPVSLPSTCLLLRLKTLLLQCTHVRFPSIPVDPFVLWRRTCRHRLLNEWLRRLFVFLDTQSRRAGSEAGAPPSLTSVGLSLFKVLVFDKCKDALSRCVLDAVNRLRDGEAGDTYVCGDYNAPNDCNFVVLSSTVVCDLHLKMPLRILPSQMKTLLPIAYIYCNSPPDRVLSCFSLHS